VTPHGTLLVVSTGNALVLEYTLSGQYLGIFVPTLTTTPFDISVGAPPRAPAPPPAGDAGACRTVRRHGVRRRRSFAVFLREARR
jgi:hypothetical protein